MSGQTTKARSVLEQARQKNPKCPDLWWVWGSSTLSHCSELYSTKIVQKMLKMCPSLALSLPRCVDVRLVISLWWQSRTQIRHDVSSSLDVTYARNSKLYNDQFRTMLWTTVLTAETVRNELLKKSCNDHDYYCTCTIKGYWFIAMLQKASCFCDTSVSFSGLKQLE